MTPLPSQKTKMLQRITEYYGRLIDRGFSGKVTTSFHRGILQDTIKRDETDKLEELT